MNNLYDLIIETKSYVDNFSIKYELALKIINKS